MERFVRILVVVSVVMVMSPAAYATNGDNLMAIGPIARAMGGVGIAAPQDAISAVFDNPAAMCFSPYCPSSEVNFAGTAFMPHPQASVTSGGRTFSSDSDGKVFPIPAFGLSVPITSGPPFWRFGIAAYGSTGLGVDYRNTKLDQPRFFNFGPQGQFPLVAGEFTELSILKFAPTIAFQPTNNLSFGASFHIDYASLDLRDGSSNGFGAGAQLGMIWKVNDDFTLGLSYVTPQNVDHENVTDFDGDTKLDKLSLQSPQQVGIGAAYQFFDHSLLLELDFKWLNWSNANGYQSFDWEDQYVVAFGVQYKPIPKVALRAGYNFGNNPVNEHDGFVGALGAPGSLSRVQGHVLPTYYYETFRIIGFPAIVEHHATCGFGYEFSPRLALNAAYTHAFENSISESGTNLVGQPVKLKSKLSEDSVEVGITWRF
jgi:long-chain fatty acid transport protein